MPKSIADKVIMFSLMGLVAWTIIVLPILHSYTPAPPHSADSCVFKLAGVCFISPKSGKLFGFAEFVQAFALLVLIYTMSDVRYRFRVQTALIPIWWITFWISVVIGLGTLITDLWFTQGDPIPWFLAAQSYWQFIFGLMFLSWS